MSPEIHPAAKVGFQRSADVYERGRPGFPQEALIALREGLDLRPGTHVLELGAGTGKLTQEGSDAWATPACTSFAHHHVATVEGTVDRVLSISFIAALPAAERARVGEGVRRLLAQGEEIVFPYRTDVWFTYRREVT